MAAKKTKIAKGGLYGQASKPADISSFELRFCTRLCIRNRMQATTVRISPATRRTLTELSQATDSSLQGVLNAAVEAYRRQVFLERANDAFAELRRNPDDWAKYQQELAEWESLGSEGL